MLMQRKRRQVLTNLKRSRFADLIWKHFTKASSVSELNEPHHRKWHKWDFYRAKIRCPASGILSGGNGAGNAVNSLIQSAKHRAAATA